MAARITRAKKKIAAARIPYRVPPPEELPDAARRGADGRAPAVHDRPHRAGRRRRWSAPIWSSGRSTWPGCCTQLLPGRRRGRRLARAAAAHRRPAGDPGRRGGRLRAARRPGPPPLGPRRDRRRACALVAEALRRRPPGRFALQAAIAAVHAEAPDWDGHRLGADRRRSTTRCCARWPSPVVALNRAVAVGFAAGPAAGLAELDALGRRAAAGRLPLPAGRPGRLLRRLGRDRRGAAGVRGGAAADRQRGRARVPRAADREPHTACGKVKSRSGSVAFLIFCSRVRFGP